MADVVRATIQIGNADIGSLDRVPQITGLVAGEDLPGGNFVFIKTTDGKVYNCVATSANAAVAGVVIRACKAGQPVTIFGKGTRMQYSPAGTLTPGTMYYLSAVTNGALGTTTSTGDTIGVASAINDTDIRVVRDYTNAVG